LINPYHCEDSKKLICIDLFIAKFTECRNMIFDSKKSFFELKNEIFNEKIIKCLSIQVFFIYGNYNEQ
jgi:hypothetical protein